MCETPALIILSAPIRRRHAHAFALAWLFTGLQFVPSSSIAAQAIDQGVPAATAPRTQESASATVSENHEGNFHFVVTRGKGVKVCEAYAHRLNTTFFGQLPSCDRPETRDDHGFAYLNRKLLGQSKSNYFYPIVEPFITNWPILNDPPPPIPIFRGGNTGASWTYDPPVDIENDGTADQVLVWNIENTMNPHCGRPYRDGAGRGGQQIILLTNDARTIDREKTREIFGRKNTPMRTFGLAGRPESYVRRPEFWSVGGVESVFEYEGLFYFDSFYENDGRGDYQGARVQDKKLGDTLAVFIRQKQVTREVCELYLTDSRDFY